MVVTSPSVPLAACRMAGAVLLALASVLAPAVLRAQDNGEAAAVEQQAPALVAIVDIQRILTEAAASKSIREQVESYRSTYLAELTLEEDRLREEEQKLTRQRAILSADVLAERERAFRTRVAEIQQRAQTISRRLDNSINSAMNQVRRAMLPIFADLTRERGINLIVAKSQILFAVRSLEVTDEVLLRLDAVLPDVVVADPEGE
jgi:Skp family chaperone for outer membrane proteins